MLDPSQRITCDPAHERGDGAISNAASKFLTWSGLILIFALLEHKRQAEHSISCAISTTALAGHVFALTPLPRGSKDLVYPVIHVGSFSRRLKLLRTHHRTIGYLLVQPLPIKTTSTVRRSRLSVFATVIPFFRVLCKDR